MTPNAMVGKRHALLAALLILLCTSGLSARGRGRRQARDTGAPRFLEVNLATQDPSGSRKEPVEAASDVTIKITNRLPNGRYGIEVLRQVIEIPPFKMPPPATPGSLERFSGCESLVTASTAFEKEDDERLVPSHVSKLNSLIETAS